MHMRRVRGGTAPVLITVARSRQDCWARSTQKVRPLQEKLSCKNIFKAHLLFTVTTQYVYVVRIYGAICVKKFFFAYIWLFRHQCKTYYLTCRADPFTAMILFAQWSQQLSDFLAKLLGHC
jgi:hypothetical protein